MLTRRALLGASAAALAQPKRRPTAPARRAHHAAPAKNWWVFNESSVVSDHQVRRAAAACQKQFNRDFVPAWHAGTTALIFHTGKATASKLPADGQVLVIKDNPPNGTGLGSHWWQGGQVRAEVYAKRCLSFSSTACGGPYAMSMVMAHEVMEAWANPNRNRWVDDGQGRYVEFEICDPVAENSYNIDGVSVADFLLPSWFQQNSSGPWDFLDKCSAPLTCALGGVRDARRKR